MKKLLSVILSLALILTCCTFAFAQEADAIKFNDDGSFKILMINDTQDIGNCNDRLVEFIELALDSEQPDLVVFAGDQLSDMYFSPSKEDFTKSIANIIKPLEERNIPFLVTLGNHDHDREATLDAAGQYDIYNAYANCVMSENGPDPFTCSVPVLSSDGSKTAFNIYMMDTNNKVESGGYAGITQTQLDWYNAKSAELKTANDGVAMPSILFQHIPVKEIYNLFEVCDYNTSGAIYARRDGNWYVLDSSKASGTLAEAPCSEDFTTITGQYQAWLNNGDIMGAYFAHDHVNNFVGTTDDGIRMGYNGGSGFRAYGSGSDRSVRVFEFNENDVQNYTTRLVTYSSLSGESFSFYPSDILSTGLLTPIMKVVYFFFGWIIKLAK